jgi:hypothetical protein
MDLQTRKLNFIQEVLALSNDKIMDKLESILKKEQSNLDPILKEKLTSRALRAEEDIKNGDVYTRAEAEAKMRGRLGA